jgi:NAD(P)H-dependent FMN reductase
MAPKLLFFAGSARKHSFNKKLAKTASALAQEKGATATFIDLADFDMPIFNEDLEAESGLPENAKKLKQLFIDHDGVFIASPEYNSSFSPLLKNSLDWISRSENKEEKPLIAFAGKTACLAATSPGGLGGIRGLVPLRLWLSNIQVHVLPQQLAISSAHNVFDDNGITDDKQKSMLENLIGNFIQTTESLKK